MFDPDPDQDPDEGWVSVYGGTALDWVIVGGESGTGARPMHPDWARKIRDDCAYVGTPFFFKQWGAFNAEGQRVGKEKAGRLLDGRTHDAITEPD